MSFLAAAHWLERLLGKVHENDQHKALLWDFHDKARQLVEYGEWDNMLPCLKRLTHDVKGNKKWVTLDGDIFFQDLLAARLNKADSQQDKDNLNELINSLQQLNNSVYTEHPSPFYAVLLMDGDSLGDALKIAGNDVKISKALAAFTQGVKGIVEKHCGFLVYAGGDDVLALLPLENALNCADKLQRFYKTCFEAEQLNATLSGAIQFAHINTPLTHLLHNAHDLLDNIAKAQTGRDSIAVRVWKRSGKALEWAMPWSLATSDDELLIHQSLKRFAGQDAYDPLPANQFFYRIRDLFAILEPVPEKQTDIHWYCKDDADFQALEQQQLSLLAAEYKQSGLVDSTLHIENAKAQIKGLLSQCRLSRRYICPETEQVQFEYSRYLQADAAFLIRFLANHGMWEARL
ncbi:type III-B CRISPR-associated protein Cas10/Cmr2 [Candidatus Venteria ishoeyi]|uniref:type III-B CRISPR-associated protein Cas10/Cmr2 n=1 Tax=Candidatus Venteria ishoeyi TaxID=1899563 RepID=UPI0011B0E2D4|nr:type III-B CRISPR-associated protein Cas10/Cmr2 [Candidatus Venteria ishoeyi]